MGRERFTATSWSQGSSSRCDRPPNLPPSVDSGHPSGHACPVVGSHAAQRHSDDVGGGVGSGVVDGREAPFDARGGREGGDKMTPCADGIDEKTMRLVVVPPAGAKMGWQVAKSPRVARWREGEETHGVAYEKALPPGGPPADGRAEEGVRKSGPHSRGHAGDGHGLGGDTQPFHTIGDRRDQDDHESHDDHILETAEPDERNRGCRRPGGKGAKAAAGHGISAARPG